MNLRTPPHNIDAEKSILGGLMVDPEAFDSVFEVLTATDFYKLAHQKVYQAIVDLTNRKEPVDVITVNNTLTQKKELESIGGSGLLAEIMNQYPTAVNIGQYARIVKEKALLRRLIKTNTEILDTAYEQSYENIDTFIDEVESKIFGIAQQRETNGGLVGAAELIKVSIDRLRGRTAAL